MSPPAAVQPHEEKDGEEESSYPSMRFPVKRPVLPELVAVTRLPCYWGSLNKYQADILLLGRPDGTFLLRNSSQEGCAFAVTFRRRGRTRHVRIQYRDRHFSFHWGCFVSSSVSNLLEHYKDPKSCTFFEPLLCTPVNRTDPLGLQELCRATVNAAVPYEGVSNLPVPRAMKDYLWEYHYKETLPEHDDDLW